VTPMRLLLATLALALPLTAADARPPLPELDLRDPSLHYRGDVLLRGEEPFAGFVVERGLAGEVVSRTPYEAGRRHGLARGFHPGGAPAFERTFAGGEREGTHRGTWPNGRPQFVYHYAKDVFDGEQVGYHENGVRAELRHFVAGHEEGQQTTWDSEGRVGVNYTFKGGKRYGIVGRLDCVTVHEN